MAREEKVLGISRRAMKADRIRLAAATVEPVITGGLHYRYSVDLHPVVKPEMFSDEWHESNINLAGWSSPHDSLRGARRGGKRLVKRYARAVAFNQSQNETGTS